MKIGIVELSLNYNANSNYYNDQEISLGKALCKNGHNVDVYKFVSRSKQRQDIIYNSQLSIHYIPSKSIGSNTLVDTTELSTDLDVVVCFSDVQLSVPRIYKWSLKNDIKFIPYVGVIKSSSTNSIIKLLINIFSLRVLSIYRKCLTIAKTTSIERQLNIKCINNTKVAPVGIDFELLNSNFEQEDIPTLKNKYGFNSNDYIVLMVGKLEEYREPLGIVDVFKNIKEKNSGSKLLIVGKGSLKKGLIEKIKDHNLGSDYILIDSIENSSMWEIYSIADVYVSLNPSEIFGMSIMEAMYYKLPVHVVNAPGPNDIISEGTGYLYKNVENMIKNINLDNDSSIRNNAHNRIVDTYNWNSLIEIIQSIKQ